MKEKILSWVGELVDNIMPFHSDAKFQYLNILKEQTRNEKSTKARSQWRLLKNQKKKGEKKIWGDPMRYILQNITPSSIFVCVCVCVCVWDKSLHAPYVCIVDESRTGQLSWQFRSQGCGAGGGGRRRCKDRVER